MPAEVHVTTLLNQVTGTGAGVQFSPRGRQASFKAYGKTTAGAGAATVKVQFSLDGSNWVDGATISLTLTNTGNVSDGLTTNTAWKYVRGNVTAISGTGAAVSLLMGS